MTATLHRKYGGGSIASLAIVASLSLSVVLLTFSLLSPIGDASAMGQAPSTCDNVYGGTITSFLITYPGGELDALTNPNSSFTMPSLNDTYTVTFVIHTASTSDNATGQGNSLPGDTWYGTTAPGYGNGVCVPGAGPDQDVTVSVTVSAPPIAGHTATPVGAEWYTLAPGAGVPVVATVPVNYSVMWPLFGTTTSASTTSTDPPTSSSSPTGTSTLSVSTVDGASGPITGYYITLWQNGAQLQSCYSACSFAVNDGQTYQVTASSYGSESFSHWQDGSTGMETVNVPTASTGIQLTATYTP